MTEPRFFVGQRVVTVSGWLPIGWVAVWLNSPMRGTVMAVGVWATSISGGHETEGVQVRWDRHDIHMRGWPAATVVPPGAVRPVDVIEQLGALQDIPQDSLP